MKSKYYILHSDHSIEGTDDLMKWCGWMETAGLRRVKQEMVGDLYVSTMFLGLDYSFGEIGKPLLFETMIFDHSKAKTEKITPDLYQERYCTYDEALAAHEKLVEMLKKGEKIEGMYNYEK